MNCPDKSSHNIEDVIILRFQLQPDCEYFPFQGENRLKQVQFCSWIYDHVNFSIGLKQFIEAAGWYESNLITNCLCENVLWLLQFMQPTAKRKYAVNTNVSNVTRII